MSAGLFFQLLAGLFKFPGEIRALILLLSKTPVERRAEIMVKIQKESASLDNGGNPEWEE